ncbi:MAG: glycoside hydrolase family 5 protein, partial [Actinobacteria bacterium]|nr:glycoside hydrolase family 5 protein [Actinomycetota bacterium]
MAVTATHLHAASATPQAAHDPTIVIEAEAGLVGGAVTVSPSQTASGGAFVHFSGPAQPPPAQGIRVAGNHLLRDGAPFVPVGFTVVGLAHPAAEGGTAWAAGRLDDTMAHALAWGANTIRFQLSQRGLDPNDPLYSDAYVDRIADGVALARAQGFVVMLSIQDQALSGGSSHGQPSDATIRDWQTLAARFNAEPNVLYEIFNEPQNRPTPEGWAVWRNGGPGDRNQGTPAVGHQAVLDAIRATGATNVVVADAAQFAQRLDGIALLDDPLGQVAYGVHPYLTHTLREPTDWEPGFGFLSTQYPVVATEWTAVPWVRFCHPEWETTSPQL